jgi:hypothetical protein
MIDWLSDVVNECIKRLGYGDEYEFSFRVHREQDGLKQMQIDTGYLKMGVWCLDDVLQDLGMDTIDEPWSQAHYYDTPNGPVPFDTIDDVAAANLKKLQTPTPAPVHVAPGAPAPAAKPEPASAAKSDTEQLEAVKKTLNEVLNLVKAHHPEAKVAADKLSSKLARKLKTIEKEIAAKIKAEMD